MKKICFITGTRADYGIMSPIMKAMAAEANVELQIIATNMHLSKDFGMTVKEIESDGFEVTNKIASLVGGDTPASTVLSMAKIQEGLAEAFPELNPDLVVLLGDRYEALAAASAAVVFGIPIVHLHGGEITEGAFDDMFRNAITKLSTYHFASTPEYTARIVSMGEAPEKVFHSGAPGADFRSEDTPEIKKEFEEKTQIDPSEKFIILAMHPATMSEEGGLNDAKETLKALEQMIWDGFKVLITMPNSDPGNRQFRSLFQEWAEKNRKRVKCVDSLGARLFHYALSKAALIAGNSSAALIEAPTMRLPAVNIGVRQKGRAHGPSVINVPGKHKLIIKAFREALVPLFSEKLGSIPIETVNPYFRKDSARFISQKLIEILG